MVIVRTSGVHYTDNCSNGRARQTHAWDIDLGEKPSFLLMTIRPSTIPHGRQSVPLWTRRPWCQEPVAREMLGGGEALWSGTEREGWIASSPENLSKKKLTQIIFEHNRRVEKKLKPFLQKEILVSQTGIYDEIIM